MINSLQCRQIAPHLLHHPANGNPLQLMGFKESMSQGIGGILRALQRVHRFVERYWYKMLCSRSRKGHVRWEVFNRIKARWPLQRPRLALPYRQFLARLGFLLYWLGNGLAVLLGLLGFSALIIFSETEAMGVLLFVGAGLCWLVGRAALLLFAGE